MSARAESEAAADDARSDYREKQQLIAKQEAEDRAWFDKQYYSDITHRTDIQNMLRLLDEKRKRQQTINDTKAAIMGSSDESRLAMADDANKSYSDTVAAIASDASSRKDQYLNNWHDRQRYYMMSRLGLNNPETAIRQNMSNQLSTASAGAFQAGAGLLANGLGSINGIGSAGAGVGAGTSAGAGGGTLTKPNLPQPLTSSYQLNYGGNAVNPSQLGKNLNWGITKPNWGIANLK